MFTTTKGHPKSYTQLTVFERDRLFELRTTTDLSLRAIAAELGQDLSTLSREFQRNRNPAGQYHPEPAQAIMVERRSQLSEANKL